MLAQMHAVELLSQQRHIITASKQTSKDHRNSRSASTKVIIITDNSELHVHSTKLLLQPRVWHCGPISHVIQCVAIHYISLVGIAYAHVHHRHLEAISQREDQKRKKKHGAVWLFNDAVWHLKFISWAWQLELCCNHPTPIASACGW